MEKVPKIVLKRLQSPATESHPDPDQLTAFAEHSLAGRERDQVLDHLARCGDCREVVTLALPPEVELPALAHKSTNWFLWPGLRRQSGMRWAALAAAAVLIASIGTVRYLRHQSGELASNVVPSKKELATPAQSLPLSSQVAAPQSVAPQYAAPSSEDRKDKSPAPRSRTASAENKPALSGGRVFHGAATLRAGIGGGSAGAATGGPVGGLDAGPRLGPSAPAFGNLASAATAKQNPTPGPTQRTMASSSSTVVEVSGEAGQVATQTAAPSQIQDQVIQDQLIQTEPAEQSQVLADQSVGKAKPASSQASAPLAPAPSGPALMKSQKAPRWTISATGVLQRSLDGGQTWLDVNVASINTQEANARSMSANVIRSAKSTTAAAITIFRALSVSANAAEVWAGGSGSALYHTTDSGNHWARVVPSEAGIILTGDVIGIQFSDALNGIVTTSTTEVWATADGGQTWREQH
jgi:hypothetical protein